ncbi:DUF1097 domain-containing protein [Vallitalea okinawensis]|uniref:DUF1097 domain-containing protein n=1 Tax=Vallitalea okinawensis TaxID=2078660 RepID=UPI000CFD99E6|nr:DUF1097 domain-containing protein [Vallitalea okinawensis]
MKFSKFIVIPIIIAFLAFTIQIVDQLLSPLVPPAGNIGFGWIAFQAWAMYFIAGCNIKGGVKTFLGYVSGIIASILIMELGGLLTGLGFFGVPLAVFIIVIPVISLEKVPWFDYVPAVFVGAGVFFGFMSYVSGATYGAAAVTELIYCFIGLAYGVITVYLRTKYEAKVNASTSKETAISE